MKNELKKIKTVSVPDCPLCGESKRRFLYSSFEHEYPQTTAAAFDFYSCAQCELVYLDPRPDDSELSRIYPSNYYSHSDKYSSPAAVDLKTWAGKALHQRLLGRVGGNLRGHIEMRAGLRFLDVGCGGGKALGSLHQEYGCECVGIDTGLSEDVLSRYQNPPIQLRSGNFLSMDFGDEKFDVVYASHLIEHLPDPRSFLLKASSLLKPGGICVIETPNVDCWAARLFGAYWGGNHTPRHWFLLSPQTSKKVLDYIPQAHFEILEAKFSHSSAFWIWSFHSLFSKKLGSFMADLLFPADQRIVSTHPVNLMRHALFTIVDICVLRLTGRTGNMSVIYRKTA